MKKKNYFLRKEWSSIISRSFGIFTNVGAEGKLLVVEVLEFFQVLHLNVSVYLKKDKPFR